MKKLRSLKLVLTAETVRQLNAHQLTHVAGGATITCQNQNSCKPHQTCLPA